MRAMSRRGWLAAAFTALAAAGASAAAAPLATEERPVAGIDRVEWEATGELVIRQADRERLVIEAEPAVLAQVVAKVIGNRLQLGFAPGARVQTQQPIRFRLDVRTLAALDTRGSGVVRIGPLATTALTVRASGGETLHLEKLQARRLDVRLDGAGEMKIDAGRVDRQQVVVAGAANYAAAGLASREADAAIDGSGELQLAVEERLGARIAGSGDILYRGRPRVTRTVTGAGEIRPLD